MIVLNKYKKTISLNFENSDLLKKYSEFCFQKINYTFMHRSVFLRNFIFFYSIFLISDHFSPITQNNNPSFKVLINFQNFMYLNNDYNNFFEQH